MSLPDPQALLNWYDRHHRRLPWRAEGGDVADPYAVWLSEIMLQQTTVATVIPYYQKFLDRWPTVLDLSTAPLDDVLEAWAGLGYYARARNLHACAKTVVQNYGGTFPATETELHTLPGIGDYTAAAIASIAFGQKATAVDGNVKRVISRLFAIDDLPVQALPKIVHIARQLTPDHRCGDYTQAIMELGATVCTPRLPRCSECPWQKSCKALTAGQVNDLPRKTVKPERRTRYAMAFWLTDGNGNVLMQRRPEKGLLGGMMEFPSTPWLTKQFTHKDWLKQAPVPISWQVLPGFVRHVFSHFPLEIITAMAQTMKPMPGLWVPIIELNQKALPTLMKKIMRHVSAHSLCDILKENAEV